MVTLRGTGWLLLSSATRWICSSAMSPALSFEMIVVSVSKSGNASLLYESRGSIRTMALTPQVGYLHVSAIGLAIGVDVGIALPVAPSNIQYQSSLTLPPNTPTPIVDAVRQQLLEPNNHKVEDTLQRIGRSPVPTINVRVGWML